MKQIGIMGGTFDPVHNGHLLLGRQAYSEYALEEIWYMPSHIPPHKKDHRVADGKDRLAMLRLAVDGIPGFLVSDFEMRREGNTYTAQTLALLKEQYPDVRFSFIIGADSLFQLETWYHPEQVMALASLLVAGREYHAEHTLNEEAERLRQKYGADIRLLHSRMMDISSEEIRRLAAEEKDISAYVPAAVASYIREHGLYSRKYSSGEGKHPAQAGEEETISYGDKILSGKRNLCRPGTEG